jgi:hypothetical protein
MSGGLQVGAGLTLQCTACGGTSLTLVGTTSAGPSSPAEHRGAQRADSDGASWLEAAQPGLMRMAATGRTFQAYDLVEGGFVSEAPRPHLWGGLFGRAVAAGHIVAAGTAPSKRPSGRRTVGLWRAALTL